MVVEIARAILVDRVEDLIESSLVPRDAELLQPEPELALVNRARLVLVKLTERVDRPIEVLGDRHLELNKAVGNGCLVLRCRRRRRRRCRCHRRHRLCMPLSLRQSLSLLTMHLEPSRLLQLLELCLLHLRLLSLLVRLDNRGRRRRPLG